LRNQQVRLRNVIERLLTAYQEELLSLEQLRQRMPALRKQQQAVDAELQSLALAAADQSRYLRLTETLADFCTKLHARADALDVTEKQKIARLLVQEILVGRDTIVIRHSIPLLKRGPDGRGSSVMPATTTSHDPSAGGASYLLRTGSNLPYPGEHVPARGA
jgi:site-specific DNA recombinase